MTLKEYKRLQKLAGIILENQMVEYDNISFPLSNPAPSQKGFVFVMGDLETNGKKEQKRLFLTADQYADIKSQADPTDTIAYVTGGENPIPFVNGINVLDCRKLTFTTG